MFLSRLLLFVFFFFQLPCVAQEATGNKPKQETVVTENNNNIDDDLDFLLDDLDLLEDLDDETKPEKKPTPKKVSPKKTRVKEPSDLPEDAIDIDEEDLDEDVIDFGEEDLEAFGITEEELAEFDFELEEINLEDIKDEEFSADMGDTGIKTTIPLPIPFIGTIELDGTIDIFNERYSLSKTTPEKTYGPLTFHPMTVSLSNKEGLTAKGSLSLFGITTELTLEYLRKGEEGLEALFTLGLKKPFKLPLSPWKSLPLQKLSLEYSPEKKRIHSVTTLAKENDVTFVYNFEAD